MRLIVSGEDVAHHHTPSKREVRSLDKVAFQSFSMENDVSSSSWTLPVSSSSLLSPLSSSSSVPSDVSVPEMPIIYSSPLARLATIQTDVKTSTSIRHKDPEDWISYYRSRNLHHGGFFRSQFGEEGDETLAAKLHDAQLHCEYLGWAGGFTGVDCHETERLAEHSVRTNFHAGVSERSISIPPAKSTDMIPRGRFSTVQTCSWRYAVDDATNAIRTAAILGSRALLVRGGPQGLHIRRHASRLFFNAIEDLLPIAEDMEVILALGEIHPQDLLAAKAMPWWSLFGAWAGLMIDFDRWSSPAHMALLRQNIERIASATVLLDVRHHTISESMPLLRLFATAGYDGDVLISFACFDQIVAEQQHLRRPATVPVSSQSPSPEHVPHMKHSDMSPRHCDAS